MKLENAQMVSQEGTKAIDQSSAWPDLFVKVDCGSQGHAGRADFSVNPVNQCRDSRCLVGSSKFWAFMPRSVGFEASATPESLCNANRAR